MKKFVSTMLIGTMVVAGGTGLSKVSAAEDVSGEEHNVYEWIAPEKSEDMSIFSKVRGIHKEFHKKKHVQHHLENLDEETKEQLKEIRTQVQNGEMTKEEAKAMLEEMGISKEAHQLFHKKAHFKRHFQQLDEETQEKVKNILEHVHNGEITKEEAKEMLEELGLDRKSHFLFHKKQHLKRDFQQLDEETKAKVLDIRDQVQNGEITREEAKAKLKELGITRENHKRFHIKKHIMNDLRHLDDATKEQLKEIRTKVQNGELSKEEAKNLVKEILKAKITG